MLICYIANYYTEFDVSDISHYKNTSGDLKLYSILPAISFVT